MKVRELIENLQKLDQEKDIWIVYDRYSVEDPEIEIADSDFCADSTKIY